MMNNVEMEMVLIIFAVDADGEDEIERVIVFKDRETALDAYEANAEHAILTMAEINREVKQAHPSVVQETLPGLEGA
jgi:hypothetical protein